MATNTATGRDCPLPVRLAGDLAVQIGELDDIRVDAPIVPTPAEAS